METARVDLKPGAKVRILSVGGDLRLTGSETSRLEAQAGRRGGLRVKSREDGVEIVSASGCLVFLPATCPVEIGTIGGDGRITDMARAVAVASVGGDLKLRHLQDIVVENIGGDLLGQRMTGRFEVRNLAGDALLDRIEGDVRLGSVGGDLRVRSLTGSLEARVGGDASLALTPVSGRSTSVRTGGDLTCRIPPEASVRARLSSRGDLRIGVGGDQTADGDVTTVVLGTGEVQLELSAAGDLALLGSLEADAGDLADAIAYDVEGGLREAQVEIDGELGAAAFAGGDIGEQVRQALDRALRPGRPGRPGGPGVDPGADLGAERALVLKMIAEGKISAAEGEALFRALEGDG